MSTYLAAFAHDIAQIVTQSGSSDSDFSNLGIVFLAAGFVFYGIVYFRYRNTNKRHSHETETEASMHNMRAEDRLVKSLTGLSNSRMSGDNSRDVRGALRRFF